MLEDNSLCRYLFVSGSSSSEIGYMAGVNVPVSVDDDSPPLQQQQHECRICFDNTNALATHVCIACSGSFCVPCMAQFIEFKVLDGEVSRKKLVCPAPDCEQPLSEDLVEAFASRETFAKYQSFVKNHKIGIRFCSRAGCSAAIDEPLFCRDRKVQCAECNTESCMRCGGDYRRTRLCRRDDKRYSKWRRSHEVRACPGCKTDIEKQGGCLHMSCVRCEQQFCWACLRPWSSHSAKLCVSMASIRKRDGMGPLKLAARGVLVGVAGIVVISLAAGVIVVAAVVVTPVYGCVRVRDSIRDHKNKRMRGSSDDDSAAADVTTHSNRLRVTHFCGLGLRRR